MSVSLFVYQHACGIPEHRIHKLRKPPLKILRKTKSQNNNRTFLACTTKKQFDELCKKTKIKKLNGNKDYSMYGNSAFGMTTQARIQDFGQGGAEPKIC